MTATIWATVAAFTAAAFSFINAVLTSRANKEIQLTQWRRTVELEDVARLLKGVDPFLASCSRIADIADRSSNEAISDETSRELNQLYASLVEIKDAYEQRLSELELIAGDRVFRAAQRLINSFEGLQHYVRPAGPYESKKANCESESVAVRAARQSLVDEIRIELGADRRGARRMKRSFAKSSRLVARLWYGVKHPRSYFCAKRVQAERRKRSVVSK
ncbi:hypothetical protein ACFWNN_01970 [Lentzea sp. NPDC058450]|uniref:hypothetical protein n=1 Tax=Lentzea sp. NPDC058450 TaxID=3346505 RepID=UPI003653F707